MAARKKNGATREPRPALAEALAAVDGPTKIPPALANLVLPALRTKDAELPRDSTLRALLGRCLGDDPIHRLLHAEATPESRDALGVALLDFWRTKEFHGRFSWVLEGVVALGGDRSTLLLAEQMAEWPKSGDTGRRRVIDAIPILASANNDTAMLALLGLRQTAVVPSVLEAVIEALALAIEERKTTLSELFDAITPTLGLDGRGMRTFDYGPRRFVAAFDDHFEPRLRDDAGRIATELPPATTADDPVKVTRAREAWATAATRLREAVKVQTFRLEQDMIAGRRWDTATWTRCLKEHPLLVSFTRRLLWGVYDGDDALVATFRTAEDTSLVGRDDAGVTLPDGARIGIVHPLSLDAEALAAWGTHFADYEIVQPFAQLGRATFVVDAAERESTAVARYAKTGFKSGVLRDVLVRRGYARDPAYQRTYYERVFPRDSVVAIARMSPGVFAGDASYETFDQTIPEIEFRAKKARGRSRTPMKLGDVPRIAFSEALLDLADVLAEQDAT